MAADAIQPFLLLGKSTKGRGLCELIAKATAEPGLFTFGELLSMPGVQELQSGELAAYRALLELFCYGTWSDYQAHRASFPPLTQQQELKLKQLTVASLGSQQKVLPYATLQSSLAISSVRDLEDFLITDCFYTGLIVGKLDQRQGCLQVHDVASRDMRPQDTPALAEALGSWLASAQVLLGQLEAQAAAAAASAAAAAAQRRDVEAKQEELRKHMKSEMERSGEGGALMDDAGGFDSLDDERLMPMPGGHAGPPGGGGLLSRSKRRR